MFSLSRRDHRRRSAKKGEVQASCVVHVKKNQHMLRIETHLAAHHSMPWSVVCRSTNCT